MPSTIRGMLSVDYKIILFLPLKFAGDLTELGVTIIYN